MMRSLLSMMRFCLKVRSATTANQPDHSSRLNQQPAHCGHGASPDNLPIRLMNFHLALSHSRKYMCIASSTPWVAGRGVRGICCTARRCGKGGISGVDGTKRSGILKVREGSAGVRGIDRDLERSRPASDGGRGDAVQCKGESASGCHRSAFFSIQSLLSSQKWPSSSGCASSTCCCKRSMSPCHSSSLNAFAVWRLQPSMGHLQYQRAHIAISNESALTRKRFSWAP